MPKKNQMVDNVWLNDIKWVIYIKENSNTSGPWWTIHEKPYNEYEFYKIYRWIESLYDIDHL
jgi:hypothetical protein